MKHFNFKKVGFLLLLLNAFFFSWNTAYAQPTVLGSQVVNGGYSTTNLVSMSATFKQVRLQATSSAGSGARNWEFATGTAAATVYNPNWRPYTGGNTLGINTYTPTSFANGAKYNTGGGASGLLPAITSGSYYTFNVSGNAAADNVMQLLETSYAPVTISTVTNSAGTLGSRNVSITTSVTPNASENIFVRYSTDSYANSTIILATGSATSWSATIPAQSVGVSYYVYTSPKTKAQIDADVVTYSTQNVHDMSTLNLNNNAGSNFSYSPISVTSTTGTSTSATYATMALALAAINGGTVHTGTIVCTVNDGYTETAPAGGFSITATGTVSAPITFVRSNSGGAKPVFTAFTPQASGSLNDALFKIIGGDYITIDGFTMQENAANTTTAVATNNMTEFGVALFYTSLTNGAQNNTIQNCTISLNRTNLNTFGIYSNTRHSATAVITLADVTSAAGANSNNKVYGNTISNVNYGIVFIGAATVIDTGNDIGGSSSATGNTITNWGGNANALSTYANLTGSSYCIFVNHQLNDNVSYNTITSASITGITIKYKKLKILYK